jgi:hypothetical protein
MGEGLQALLAIALSIIFAIAGVIARSIEVKNNKPTDTSTYLFGSSGFLLVVSGMLIILGMGSTMSGGGRRRR